MLIEVAYFAQSLRYVTVLLMSILVYGFGIKEECLVNLAEMFADIPFHLKGFDLGVVKRYDGITELMALERVTELVLDLRQDQK